MINWTPGDVDGGQTLTDNDHLYPIHINELRTAVNQVSINVRNYGAVGDGVTDDTVAIQATWDYIKTVGGELYFPAGIYGISANLNFNQSSVLGVDDFFASAHSVSIRGAGAENTQLKWIGSSATGTYIMTFTAMDATGYHPELHSYIDNLGFIGVNKNVCGLRMINCANMQVHNLLFRHLNIGLDLESTLSSAFFGLGFDYANYGIICLQGTASGHFAYPNALRFYGTRLYRCATTAFQNTSGTGVSFYGFVCESNGTLATDRVMYANSMGLEGAAGLYLDGGHFENNVGYDVRIINDATDGTQYVVSNSTFLRMSAARYTTNNILCSGAKIGNLSVKNCAFKSANDYTPDAGRLCISLTDVTKWKYKYSNCSFSDLATDGPTVYDNTNQYPWVAFTPAWGGITEGSATNVGSYCQIGKTVHFRTKIVFAADTSVTGTVSLTLPVTISTAYTGNCNIGLATLVDAGVGATEGKIYANGNMTADLASGTYVTPIDFSSTVPFTWTTNDTLEVVGTYEAA